MRLLFVSHSFPPKGSTLEDNLGGMQRVATELFEALETNDDVELSSFLLHSSWKRTHINTPPFLMRAWKGIQKEVKQGEVDVVLFSSMVTASLTVPLGKTLQKHGVKTAAIVHGQDVTTPFGPYQRFVPRVFDALDAVLPVSVATGDQCLERGLPKEKLHVVPNGINLSRFAPLEERSIMRKAMLDALDNPDSPLPENALLLCSVGRHVNRKGFAWFVENVMPLLPETVHYWLAGDGPESETIQAAAEANETAHRVRLLGRISDEELEHLYRGADLFMMPNIPVPGTMEGFGVVMLEAGLCGLPSIAARIEGIKDVITEGVNGHFIETGDADGFAERVAYYAQHRAELSAFSKQAAHHVTNTFSWQAVAQHYVDTLEGLLASG